MDEKSNNRIIQNKLYEILVEINTVANNHNLKYNLAYGTALGAIRENGFISWDTDVDIMVTIDEYEIFCSTLESEIGKEFSLYSPEESKDYSALFTRVGFKDIPHHELHVDIYPVVGSPKSEIGRNIFGKISYLIVFIHYMKKVNIKERLTGHKKMATVVMLGKIIFYPVPIKMLRYLHNKLKTMFPINDSDYVYTLCSSSKVKEFIPKSWIEESRYKKFNELNLPVPKEWNKYLTQIYGEYMKPKRRNYY